jgi:hypothetical protein
VGIDSTGAILTGTGTQSFMVSDSGNRIDAIVTSFSMVTSPFGVAGSMKETMPAIKATSIRESDSESSKLLGLVAAGK